MFNVLVLSLITNALEQPPIRAYAAHGHYMVCWERTPDPALAGFSVFHVASNRYIPFTARLELDGPETETDKILCQGTHDTIDRTGVLTSTDDCIGRHYVAFPQIKDLIVHGVYNTKLVITPIEE